MSQKTCFTRATGQRLGSFRRRCGCGRSPAASDGGFSKRFGMPRERGGWTVKFWLWEKETRSWLVCWKKVHGWKPKRSNVLQSEFEELGVPYEFLSIVRSEAHEKSWGYPELLYLVLHLFSQPSAGLLHQSALKQCPCTACTCQSVAGSDEHQAVPWLTCCRDFATSCRGSGCIVDSQMFSECEFPRRHLTPSAEHMEYAVAAWLRRTFLAFGMARER